MSFVALLPQPFFRADRQCVLSV
ncbi:hypothetical protein MTBLM5_70128 [Magnetospirillum sp. LM-5]|nr:hypothetical protein MTBLM5_70128 [Magnetospirillum sp. LM-5]